MNKLTNMKIARRLALLVGVNIFLLACGIGVGWWGLSDVDRISGLAVAEGHRANRASKITNDVTEVGLNVANLLLEKKYDPEVETRLLTLRNEYLAAFEEASSQSKAPEDLRLLKLAEEATTRWREANKQMMDLAKAGKRAEGQTIYNERSIRLKSELDAAMQNYLTYRASQLAAIDVEQNSVVSRIKFLLLACGLVSLALAVIFGMVLARSIAKPLSAAVSHLDEVARGDVSRDVPPEYLNRGDEIGLLSKSMQTMSASLRALVTEITGGIQVMSSSSAELSANSTQMSHGSREASGKAHSVAAATEQMTTNVMSVPTGMEQTTTNLASVASATEQMTATIGEIAANSEKARRIGAQPAAPEERTEKQALECAARDSS
jgi:methyl-accepting chemotaxis protein